MTTSKRGSGSQKLLMLLAVTFIVIGSVTYRVYMKPPTFHGLPLPRWRIPDEFPDSVRLPTFSHVEGELFDQGFQIVNRMQEIPTPCLNAFASSVLKNSGLPNTEGITMADPGEEFQATDSLIPDVPFRRLEFAGYSRTSCFIHYQHGGSMYLSFCLAVMDYARKAAVWVGESQENANTIDELRILVAERRFNTSPGSSC